MFRMPNTPSLTRTLAASAVLAIGLTLSGGAFAQNAVANQNLSACALELTEQDVTYDPSYFSIDYPDGHIPSDGSTAN